MALKTVPTIFLVEFQPLGQLRLRRHQAEMMRMHLHWLRQRRVFYHAQHSDIRCTAFRDVSSVPIRVDDFHSRHNFELTLLRNKFRKPRFDVCGFSLHSLDTCRVPLNEPFFVGICRVAHRSFRVQEQLVEPFDPVLDGDCGW